MIAQRRRLLGAACVAALLLGGCDRPGADAPKSAQFRGVDITGASYARNWSLPDTTGRTRSLADFKGKVTVVFFGYTQCPDVCPTTLAELAQVKKALGPRGNELQGVFITVDPERDTPEILRSYMANFDPGFIALRGSVEETKAVAKEFKVFFAKVPGRAEGSYTMDHTAASIVFDARGLPRLYERYGGGVEALTSDVKALLDAG